MFVTGCPVPQPPGNGKQAVVTEPKTGAQYYLYLPEAYVKNDGKNPRDPSKQWPLVMTFHGMKPYDTWDRQAHEWEQEADNYGFIICAPWLQSCDSFMEYPLRSEHSYVLKDREHVIAIMDHIFATTKADPKAVLSTSWSCGGYMAHYFANRFPTRFTCIATRLSNFCPDLLLESNIPLYRDTPVAMFIGDGDFPKCKSESEQAVAWYKGHGFAKVEGKTIDNMGHRRIPQCAAAFFAESLNIEPLHPDRAAATLAKVRMRDYQPPATMIAANSPRQGSSGGPPTVAVAAAAPKYVAPPPTKTAAAGAAKPTGAPAPRVTPPQPTIFARSDGQATSPTMTPPSGAGAARVAQGGRTGTTPSTPRDSNVRLAQADSRQGNSTMGSPSRSGDLYRPRDAGPKTYPSERTRTVGTGDTQRTAAATNSRVGTSTSMTNGRPAAASGRPSSASKLAKNVNINMVSPAVGTAPHYIAFNVDLPQNVSREADFLWMDNGMWICDEPKGVKILDTPGRHRISVLVVTKDGQEYRGTKDVVVLAKVSDSGRTNPRVGTN